MFESAKDKAKNSLVLYAFEYIIGARLLPRRGAPSIPIKLGCCAADNLVSNTYPL